MGRVGRSSIWDSKMVLAAFCCFTRTSERGKRRMIRGAGEEECQTAGGDVRLWERGNTELE